MDRFELLRIRRKAGLTQRALASRAGIHAVTISRYERGNGTPDVASLEKIARALGVSTAVLVRDVVDAEGPSHDDIPISRDQ